MVFATVGILVNSRSFPTWVPDVLVVEEASQLNIDEFIRCVVRSPYTGRKNKRGVPILAQHGILYQILMIGDPMQLSTDVAASYNVQRNFFLFKKFIVF